MSLIERMTISSRVKQERSLKMPDTLVALLSPPLTSHMTMVMFRRRAVKNTKLSVGWYSFKEDGKQHTSISYARSEFLKKT